ncbi:MAG TPA: hypothetical protein VM163_04350 [bacterium]|nr:hypothetical protein [bacterium]
MKRLIPVLTVLATALVILTVTNSFAEDRWTSYNTGNSGLAGDSVMAIAIDAHGNKWFGRGGGVSVLRCDGSWRTYNSLVNAIAIDAHGNKWFGTNRGVSVLHPYGRRWTTYNSGNSRLAGDYVNAIGIDGAGNKWFGAGYDGVSVLHPDGSWMTYNTDNSGLADNYVLTIAIEANGNKWFGTTGGVSVLRADGSWTSYNTNNSGLVSNYLLAIAIDTNGNKWFGTYEGGVSVLHSDGSWTTYNTGNSGLVNDTVQAIAIDANGNKWFGTDSDGVSVLTQMPVISVATNKSLYRLGDRMIVEASLENPGPAVTVDIYLGVGLPDGTFLSWPSFAAGLMPAFADFTIPASFSLGPSVIFEMNLPELSAGEYSWFTGLTKPGDISEIVGDIAIAPWQFE